MNAWHPIGTSPRDGTKILIFGDGEICSAQWAERRNLWQIYTLSDGWLECELSQPTHWQPLPNSPESSA
jgi:hypothetical protein